MTEVRDTAQAARTEALFREVNERIVQAGRRLEADEVDLVCECADPGCAHRLSASLVEYERVRSDGARFIVKEGHELPGLERVVARRRGYRVVEKVRELGALARRLDPRAKPRPA